MRKSLIAFAMVFVIVQTSAQTTRSGTGNSTFSRNVKSIESYLVSPHSTRDFEKTLRAWQIEDHEIDTLYLWNEKTKKHDVPEYTAHYADADLKTDKVRSVDVTYDKRNKICSIHFVIKEDEISKDKIGNFTKQLNASGYKRDLANQRMHDLIYAKADGAEYKFYGVNKAKRIGVSVKYLSAYEAEIEMYRLQ